MRRAIILLYIFSANSEMRTYQHQVFMTRKTRSNALPIHTGYYYKRTNDGPSVLSMFDSTHNNSATPHQNVKNVPPENHVKCNGFKKGNGESDKTYEKAKSKCYLVNNGENFISPLEPSSINVEATKRFNRNSDYQVDDDDLRTDPNINDGWPYSYRNSYDYSMNYDTESAKAKDKRFINDIIKKVIPAHEDHENDIHRTYQGTGSEKYREREDDNPMYGNQPFFSYMLDDYFDRTNEEDPVTLKGLNWNTDFDHSIPYKDTYDNRRVRRLESYEPRQTPRTYRDYNEQNSYNADDKSSAVEKSYDKIRNQSDKALRDTLIENDKSGYNYHGQNYRGFKDFIDSFINKFGSEGHNKDINFEVNKTQDKGENKKGFRRVYHKDEYQEDNEFYDNSNNKSTLTKKSGSKFNIGGSEATLGSRAVATVGNEENAVTKNGIKEHSKMSNANKNMHNNNGRDVDLHRYKNIAKMAAKDNNADYFDHL